MASYQRKKRGEHGTKRDDVLNFPCHQQPHEYMRLRMT